MRVAAVKTIYCGVLIGLGPGSERDGEIDKEDEERGREWERKRESLED